MKIAAISFIVALAVPTLSEAKVVCGTEIGEARTEKWADICHFFKKEKTYLGMFKGKRPIQCVHNGKRVAVIAASYNNFFIMDFSTGCPR